MALVTVGLVFLGVAIGWKVLMPAGHERWSGSDFLRGFLFGVAIALESAGVVIAIAASKRARNTPR